MRESRRCGLYRDGPEEHIHPVLSEPERQVLHKKLPCSGLWHYLAVGRFFGKHVIVSVFPIASDSLPEKLVTSFHVVCKTIDAKCNLFVGSNSAKQTFDAHMLS